MERTKGEVEVLWNNILGDYPENRYYLGNKRPGWDCYLEYKWRMDVDHFVACYYGDLPLKAERRVKMCHEIKAIQIVGVLTGIVALRVIVPTLLWGAYLSHSTALKLPLAGSGATWFGFYAAVECIAVMKLIVSYALIALRPWGKVVGVGVFVADIIVRLYGVARVTLYAVHHPGTSVTVGNAKDTHSMWPTLATICLSIVSVWFLSRWDGAGSAASESAARPPDGEGGPRGRSKNRG
jgi:hypothetical protein